MSKARSSWFERSRYLRRLAKEAERRRREGSLNPGRVVPVAVYHDDWCALLGNKGPCNCNPDIRFVDLKDW